MPEKMYSAHLLPTAHEGKNWAFLKPVHPANQVESFEELITAIEGEFGLSRKTSLVDREEDRAILVSVTTEPKRQAEESLAELVELVRSDNIVILDTVLQRKNKANPRLIIGKGKLAEIMITGPAA